MKEADDLHRKLFSGPENQGPVETTGFIENFQASLGTFVDEEMSVSRYIHNDVYEERNRQLDKMILSGDIDPEPYTTWTGIDYARMAYDTKRKGVDVRDDYDVRDALRDSLLSKRLYAEDIHERAGVLGALGIFAGTTTGAMLDPINISAMTIPPLAAIRTGTALARAGKAAMFYGGVTAGTESWIQANYVYNWKQHIGVEYSVGEALTNVAFAAVGSAGIGAVGEVGSFYISKGFKRLKENIKNNSPEPGKQKLLTEVDTAEREYNAHVKQFRVEQRRLEKLRELKNQPEPGTAEPEPEIEGFDKADYVYSYEEYIEESQDPDVTITEEDLTTATILEGDFETEQDFLNALEEGGPADTADVVDLETARINRAFEEDIEASKEEVRLLGLKDDRIAIVKNFYKNVRTFLRNIRNEEKRIKYIRKKLDKLEANESLSEFERKRQQRELEELIIERRNGIQKKEDILYELVFKLVFRVGHRAEIPFEDVNNKNLSELFDVIDSLDDSEYFDPELGDIVRNKERDDLKAFVETVEQLDYIRAFGQFYELAQRLGRFLMEPERQRRTLHQDLEDFDPYEGFEPGDDVTEILFDLDGARILNIVDELAAKIDEIRGIKRDIDMTNVRTMDDRVEPPKLVWNHETDWVANKIEQVMRLQERVLFEEDDMARFATNDPEYDVPEVQLEEAPKVEGEQPKTPEQPKVSAKTGNIWEDFDEGEYQQMSKEERDAYLSEILGEETNLDALDVDEQIGVDADGNPMYQTKSRAEVEEDIDANIEAIEQFKDCWDSPDE